MLIQANISAPRTALDFPTPEHFACELVSQVYDVVGIPSMAGYREPPSSDWSITRPTTSSTKSNTLSHMSRISSVHALYAGARNSAVSADGARRTPAARGGICLMFRGNSNSTSGMPQSHATTPSVSSIGLSGAISRQWSKPLSDSRHPSLRAGNATRTGRNARVRERQECDDRTERSLQFCTVGDGA